MSIRALPLAVTLGVVLVALNLTGLASAMGQFNRATTWARACRAMLDSPGAVRLTTGEGPRTPMESIGSSG